MKIFFMTIFKNTTFQKKKERKNRVGGKDFIELKVRKMGKKDNRRKTMETSRGRVNTSCKGPVVKRNLPNLRNKTKQKTTGAGVWRVRERVSFKNQVVSCKPC